MRWNAGEVLSRSILMAVRKLEVSATVRREGAIGSLTLDELESGTGPPVQQQQRNRVRLLRLVVDDMKLQAAIQGTSVFFGAKDRGDRTVSIVLTSCCTPPLCNLTMKWSTSLISRSCSLLRRKWPRAVISFGSMWGIDPTRL